MMDRMTGKKEQSKLSPALQWVREWGEAIFIAFILAMIIRTFFFQAFRIPSGSMRPTLIEGDRLIVSKLHYGAKIPLVDKIPGELSRWRHRLPGLTAPKRGDIIVFIFPGEPKKDFIKRVIAAGGETVEIKFGDVYINGHLIEEPIIKNIYYYNRGDYGQTNQKITVPEGHFFVLGDNNSSSHDSRFWGFVPEKDVIGKAILIYWPLNRMRFIK